jgi:hypothetical protein
MIIIATLTLMIASISMVSCYDNSGIANRGYPTWRSGSTNGWFYVSYTISSTDLSTVEGTWTNLQINIEPTGDAKNAVVSWHLLVIHT